MYIYVYILLKSIQTNREFVSYHLVLGFKIRNMNQEQANSIVISITKHTFNHVNCLEDRI